MLKFKSAYVLRKKDRLNSRIELYSERNFAYKLIPIGIPFFLALSLVDLGITSKLSALYFFLIRVLAVGASVWVYKILRGRSKYVFRIFSTFIPLFIVSQTIMIKYDIVNTPYFSVTFLIMFFVSFIAPLKFKHGVLIYTLFLGPTLIYALHLIIIGNNESILVLNMTIAGIMVSSIASDQIRLDIVSRFKFHEIQRRELIKRDKEIEEKVEELLKRKKFESQFSPQVVEVLLDDEGIYTEMEKKKLVTVVFDIKDSTRKSSELPPADYKEVVEEIFDVINTSSLDWDLTVDKFTGDGAQVFAGSPKERKDDLFRSIMACFDVDEKIKLKNDILRTSWGGNIEIRMAVCEGEALVGFLGKGMVRSFTAIGEHVSFAHRLCGEATPGRVLIYSFFKGNVEDYLRIGPWSYKRREITNLKGLDNKKFEAVEFIKQIVEYKHLGHCPDCDSGYVLDESDLIYPKVICPKCSAER